MQPRPKSKERTEKSHLDGQTRLPENLTLEVPLYAAAFDVLLLNPTLEVLRLLLALLTLAALAIPALSS